jgi:hypothetical protein
MSVVCNRFVTIMAVCALALVFLFCCTPGARAVDYHAFMCAVPPGDTGEGGAAPTDDVSYAISGGFMYAGSSCGAPGGSMYALMDGETTHSALQVAAEGLFTSPAGLSIEGFNLWRYEEAGPSQPFGSPSTNLLYTGVQTVQGLCAVGCSSRGVASPWYAAQNEVSVGGLSGVVSIHWNASCGGGLGGICMTSGTPYSAGYYVFSLDAIMADGNAPSVSGVSGSILGGGTVSGNQNVSFNAADGGSGVYSAWITVDGVTQASPTILNGNEGKCKDLAATRDGLRSFLHPQPCPSTASGLLTLNTAKLTDGSHSAILYVDDAAGNHAVGSTWSFVSHNTPVVQNPPAVSGIAQVGSTLTATNATFTVPGGAGALSAVSGQWMRCNAAGEKCSPIAGATGTTYTPTAEDQRHAIVFRDTVSDSDGTTSVESPPTLEVAEVPGAGGSCTSGCQGGTGGTGGNGGAGGSGSGGNGTSGASGSGGNGASGGSGQGGVTIINLPPGGSAAQGVVSLGTTAAWQLSLAVSPQRVHRHTRIRLTGRVATSPRPAKGKLILLQARARVTRRKHGRLVSVYEPWSTFKALHSKTDGTFVVTYTFRLGGPHTYQFRALAPVEGQYRNAAGSSSVSTVRET